MDELRLLSTSPGGDEQTTKLLENLTREQATLGNLKPGQRFSLADQGKSVKAIFAAADDDDDEDFFKEFDVEDLDIEAPAKPKLPLTTLTPGTSDELPKASGKDEPDEVSGPADMCMDDAGSATPEHHGNAVTVESAAAAATVAEAVPQAESEAAMDEDALSEKPQEALPADTDTAMQDIESAAEGKTAQDAADTEMADLHAPLNSEEEAPAPDQAMQQPPAPRAATVSTAPPQQQQPAAVGSDTPSDSTGAQSANAGPATVSGGHNGMVQTAQGRSASAGSVPNGSIHMPSALLAEQKAGQMHSPAAGILSKASVGIGIATAAVQPQTGSMHSAGEADPSKAADVQTQPNQTLSVAAELPDEAPSNAVMATDRPVTFPDLSNQQQQHQPEVQTPSAKATTLTQQTLKAVNVPTLPVAAATAPKTAAPAARAAWGGQAGHSGLQLGSSAITPPLRAGIFGSSIPASTVKAPARVLPIPRTTLPRLPQIIRVNAPVRPQLPAHAAPSSAKPPVPSASPAAIAGPTPTTSMDGLVTPVPSASAGTPAAAGFAQSRSPSTQSLQKPTEATPNTPAPSAPPTQLISPGAPTTQQQAQGSDALKNVGTQGKVSNVLGSPPVTISEASNPAAAPLGRAEGSVGTGGSLGSPDQHKEAETPLAKEPHSQPAVNLELLRGKHQLEQMVLEAQKMAEQALELKVMAAIVGIRVTRLNNPMMAAKLAELKQRAEQLLKPEE